MTTNDAFELFSISHVCDWPLTIWYLSFPLTKIHKFYHNFSKTASKCLHTLFLSLTVFGHCLLLISVRIICFPCMDLYVLFVLWHHMWIKVEMLIISIFVLKLFWFMKNTIMIMLLLFDMLLNVSVSLVMFFIIMMYY